MGHPVTAAQLAALAAVPLAAVVDTANPAELAAAARAGCNYWHNVTRRRDWRTVYIGAPYIPAAVPPAYVTPDGVPMWPAARLTDSQLAALAVAHVATAAGIFRALAQPPAGGYTPAEQAIVDRLAAYLLDTD